MEYEKKLNINRSLYTESSLSQLNIADLRGIGRRLGISSPTTLKKKDLIDYILKVVYGEVETPLRNTLGRPSSRDFDVEKCIEKLKRQNDADDIFTYAFSKDYGSFKVAAPKNDLDRLENIEQRVFCDYGDKCYLKVREFVSSSNDIEVSKEFRQKYKLENLDMVEIINEKGAVKVISINGMKVPDNFNIVKTCGSVVKAGSTQVFHLSTKDEIDNEIKNIIKTIEKTNIKLFIFSDTQYEGKNVESLTFAENNNAPQIYKNLMIFIGRWEKAWFDNSDCLVVVDGMDVIERAIKSFDEDVSERIKKHLKEMVNKLTILGNALVVYKLDEEITY